MLYPPCAVVSAAEPRHKCIVTRFPADIAIANNGSTVAVSKQLLLDSPLLRPAGFITKLLQAAPELAGSAQRSVMKLLHALAHDDDTVTSFPRQQCAAYLMQVVEGAAVDTAGSAAATEAAGTAAGYSTQSGGAGQAGRGSISAGSSRSELLGADGSAALDVVGAVKALDVLAAVSRIDPQLLAGVKEYPGGQEARVQSVTERRPWCIG